MCFSFKNKMFLSDPKLVNGSVHCRQLMVEKLILNSLGKALMDIPAVSMPIAHSLNLRHQWHCVVTIVSFYCPRHKVHLCNDPNLRQISFLCVWIISGMSAHETWDEHLFVYIFVRCKS